MNKYIFLIILFISSLGLHAQIKTPNQPEEKTEEKKKEEKQKKKKEKKNTDNDEVKDTTTFEIADQYIYANLIPSHVYRTFDPGSYSGFREDEVPGFKLSGMLGVRNKITDHFILDIGFAYFQNGENYFFSADTTDSTVVFTRNHHQLSVPIKVGYLFSVKDVDVFISAGVAPSMLVNQVEKTETQVAGAEPVVDRFVNKNSLNQFNIALLGGIGAQYNFSENWGLQIMPEFRYNLLPSDINKPFQHRAWSIGFHIGVTFGK